MGQLVIPFGSKIYIDTAVLIYTSELLVVILSEILAS